MTKAAAIKVLAISIAPQFFLPVDTKNQIPRLWNWIQVENRYREEAIAQKNLFTKKMNWKATYSHYNTWLANVKKT